MTFPSCTRLHCVLALLLVASVLPTGGRGAEPPAPVRLDYTNHWAGNTGGRGGVGANANVVSNFIVDFAVLNAGQVDWQMAPHVPLAITKSYWDETRWGHGAYSKGVRVSKGEYFFKLITWDSSTANGVTATIAHPRALDAVQQNLEDQGCPLTGYSDNLPYVALSDGRTIRSVAYPTSVAFDKTGRLWVADNGPDQNFKIFSVPAGGAPVLVDTFGETGGVFAGPVRGRLGPKRFWGVRGVGFGDDGQIIVGCSGIPGQTQGGTDIRWFDPTGTTMNHQTIGTFMHVADFDPKSDGRDLHASAVRYAMDYTKPPGESWSYAAVSLDPFRFPEDPRLFLPMETAYVRWIGGRKFLFCTSMHLRYLAVFRFEEGSEIAIPAALLYLLDDGQGKKWAQGLYPTWSATANPRRRYMWVDANGDGRPAAGEFSEFEVANQYSKAYDVDADGNLWMGGGMAEYSSYWKAGGVWVLPCLGLDANGVPRYDGTKVERLGVPQALVDPQDYELSRAPTRVRYQKETDTLLVAAGLDSYFPLRVYVIDGYRFSAKPTRRCLIDLGHDRNGAWAVRLDQGTAEMSLPSCLAVDDEYLYVAYLDGGRDEHRRGEVTVYDLRDGHQVGWMTPPAETNFECGATDLLVGLQVAKRADGSRVICLEDNGGGKVMVYHWIPSGPAGAYPSTTGGDATGPVIVTPPPRIVRAAYQRTLALKPVVVGRNLQYQWAKDGVDLPGATAVHFIKSNITEADTGRYTLRAWNNDRTVTSAASEVSMVYPPVITTQPAALTEFVPGAAVTLSVSATGTELAYQWYKDSKAISRANASTLKIAAAATGDAGTYTVVVSNFIEPVTSAAAVVRLRTAPSDGFSPDFTVALAPVAGQGGQFQIVFGPVQPGFTYTPEYCTDLAAGNWLALSAYEVTDNGTQRTITDLTAAGARRFYRIRATPAP